MNETLGFMIKAVQLFIIVTVVSLFFIGAYFYPGELIYYFIFSGLSFVLVVLGFTKGAIFFDTFIALFFFLAFWLKLILNHLISGPDLSDRMVGKFDYLPGSYDATLLVASTAFAGLLAARFIRERFWFKYPQNETGPILAGLAQLFNSYRTIILLLVFTGILVVGILNLTLGIYQRGFISQTNLPFGMNGIFKWLLLFGLASITAMLLHFEYIEKGRRSLSVVFLGFFEIVTSNISLLSRGAILNSGALIFGFYISTKRWKVKLSNKFIIVSLGLVILTAGTTVLSVNYIRSFSYLKNEEIRTQILNQSPLTKLEKVYHQTKNMLIKRWVGLESVMAVSAYPKKDWNLWSEAWSEKVNQSKLSFYDSNFINSPYTNVNNKKNHFISLPGIVAFSYYPGSLVFLFLALFVVGLFAAFFEWLNLKLLGPHLLLGALFGQVIAYRLMSFGYSPGQSYLLFGAVVLNIFVIYVMNLFFTWLLLKAPTTTD